MGSSLNDFDTHIRLAHFHQCRGDYQHANDEMNLAREISNISQTALDDMIVNLHEIKWSLLRGQIHPAEKWLKSIGLVNHDNYEKLYGYPKLIAVSTQLISARLNLVQGQLMNSPDKLNLAIRKLDLLIPELIENSLVEKQIEAYILSAFSYHAMGKFDAMITSLKNALRLSEPEGFRQTFIDEGIPMARLLSQYLAATKQIKFQDDFPSRSFVAD